jgi:hypothetical protein
MTKQAELELCYQQGVQAAFAKVAVSYTSAERDAIDKYQKQLRSSKSNWSGGALGVLGGLGGAAAMQGKGVPGMLLGGAAGLAGGFGLGKGLGYVNQTVGNALSRGIHSDA